ncbi:response regulator [Halodesulfovibrio spirochaetisodalis]|uniref:Chemotaxis protein CheY n=1 Tax=Halodesulfovibrio spirochaetisodalis TaxID=1560234 RepID=A0A1B7XG86_9BACT|nr:response regulator transcription factor [Halodesulfovibrio spirochaetisodalis]OBQ54532.1 chemotaxis protein CheY [Halodesulfovibrio spirochaetisodalis]
MEQTILIIDDDAKLQDLLTEYLENSGFKVASLLNGQEALSNVRNVAPSLIILDVMLPGKDGLEVLRDIRTESTVPIIMLTARGDDADRIVGLELGADDYLSKPFNPRELLARIKAILRRFDNSTTKVSSHQIECAGIALEASRQILIIDNEQITLSPTETKLMAELMRQPNHEFSRDDLMTKVWGREFNAYDRSIDVHISKLRNILKPYNEHAHRIRTVWGKGYMFLSD